MKKVKKKALNLKNKVLFLYGGQDTTNADLMRLKKDLKTSGLLGIIHMPDMEYVEAKDLTGAILMLKTMQESLENKQNEQ